MNYCNNCGEALIEGAKFCKHCGHPVAEKPEPSTEQHLDEQNSEEQNLVEKEHVEEVESTNEQEIVDSPETEPASQEAVDAQETSKPSEQGGLAAASKKSGQGFKLSKVAILSISLAGALILVLLIGFFVGSAMTAPTKVVEKFEKALHEKDTEKVAELLNSTSLSLEIDKKSVKGFVDYYNENPSEMDFLMDHLKGQATEYEKDPEFGTDLWYAVNLQKDGKFLIFDNYEITVSPVYFNVYTNYTDTEIYLGEEVVATADKDEFSKEIGPYLPGLYTFKAVYKSEYVELTTEVEATNFDSGYTSEVDLYLDGTSVFFELPYYENLENVKLYLNGKDVGLNLVENNEIGPLLTDGSMTFAYEAELPFGTVKSEELPIDSSYMYADFVPSDAIKQNLQDTLIQFNQEYLPALTTADGSHLTVADSNMVSEIISNAEFDKEWGYYYTGKFTGIDFYDDSIEFFNFGDSWSVNVGTTTFMEEAIYFEGDEKPELELTENDMTYELIFDEASAKWLVSYVGFGGYFDYESVTEYREENPQTYTSEWATSVEAPATEEEE